MMFSSTTPLRISLFGGSTDHPLFIKKYKKSIIINFASNLNTHVVLFKDKMGRNAYHKKYILNYTSRENISKISQIKNVVIRECLKFQNATSFNSFKQRCIFQR